MIYKIIKLYIVTKESIQMHDCNVNPEIKLKQIR